MKDFKQLISSIELINSQLKSYAANAINQSLTIRNWLIGYYIVEFEQNGNDRAEYGKYLLKTISDNFKTVKGLDERSLRRFRQFYISYPQLSNTIRGSVSPELIGHQKWGTASPEFKKSMKTNSESHQIPGEKLLAKLSYSHLEQLTNVEDPLKRTFYEIECIKGIWSVRELKRQINSLYFERSGLSKNPKKLSLRIRENIVPQNSTDIIKNIYAFDFLDLNTKEIVEESDLETALLDNLQQFILELGNGFCFESRQKRILIGEKYYFIDLVFYHRILKCHILIELKIGEFEHGDIGQLNTYLSYFKEELIEDNDRPPVGILLVASKDNALAKYATAGMDENLFIQEYLIKLPTKNQLEEYINSELKNIK